MTFTPSPLDSKRFGLSVGRGPIESFDEVSALNTCEFDLVISRVSSQRWSLISAMQALGATVHDVLVYWQGPVRTSFRAPGSNLKVRESRPEDLDAVAQVARSAFESFGGHYHTDDRLNSENASEGYVQWCLSAHDNPCFKLLIASRKDQVAGFLSVRAPVEGRGEIVLNGVSPEHQRQGVYTHLVSHALRWLEARGASQVFSSTQIQNIGPQKVWARYGLEPTGSELTFHYWNPRTNKP